MFVEERGQGVELGIHTLDMRGSIFEVGVIIGGNWGSSRSNLIDFALLNFVKLLLPGLFGQCLRPEDKTSLSAPACQVSM